MSALTLDEAVELTRTGDVWLFRGHSAADQAIRTLTNAPVNHVGMAVVVDDLPPLMWHAELGKSLVDVWSGTNHRGVQLHDLRAAVERWVHVYDQRAWLRQLDPEPTKRMEDAALRTIARLDGTPFPSTAALAGRWFRGRARSQASVETTYCAEVVAATYQDMGLLDDQRPTNYYDPGRFWSGDHLDLLGRTPRSRDPGRRAGSLRGQPSACLPAAIAAAEAAAPTPSPARAQPGPHSSRPSSASTDTSPGPESTSAMSAAMRTALYSQPPWVTHTPLGWCTLRMAVNIVPISPAAAAGVAAPRSSSAPPPASVSPAARAFCRVGRMSMRAHHLLGALEPGPSEPAEELLGAVADEQSADHDAGGESSDVHGRSPSLRVEWVYFRRTRARVAG